MKVLLNTKLEEINPTESLKQIADMGPNMFFNYNLNLFDMEAELGLLERQL